MRTDKRQGVILVDKVDWRKDAWAQGIRRNMMVTRVNREEVTMENYMDLAKRLDFSDGNPEDVTIDLQDGIPLKEPVRFYRSQWNPRSSTEIHQRIHVRSLVIGYLQPNDEVHVILKKDSVDDADKESTKHYMRGLIGKKSNVSSILCFIIGHTDYMYYCTKNNRSPFDRPYFFQK